MPSEKWPPSGGGVVATSADGGREGGLDGIDLIDGIDVVDLRTLLTRLTLLGFDVNDFRNLPPTAGQCIWPADRFPNGLDHLAPDPQGW